LEKKEYTGGTRGTHFVVDFWDCGVDLNDIDELERIFVTTVDKANCTLLNKYFHKFSPQGVSGAIVLAESHITFHSFPESNYISLDIYTCGNRAMPDKALEYLVSVFKPGGSVMKKITRGERRINDKEN
jgi:S-adenosylmethionine decarboxylase